MSVTLGLERLFQDFPGSCSGARVGIICNHASVDRQYRHAVDLFADCSRFRLTTVFGPQHGARGDKQDNMIESDHYRDPQRDVPVYSLYGEHRKPTPEMLDSLDILFCDLTDVGARIYTFIYTMALAMEACAERGKRFVVLDRPNPIGGTEVEGNVLDPAFRSFVGLFPIPMRHGMTIGELACLFNREFGIGAELEVVRAAGWQRDAWLSETGVSWVMPSPNMPTLQTAAVYPGAVLVEGTHLSEGRGTTQPFELIGAPYIDPYLLSRELNGHRLPGVHFRPCFFRPTFHKWAEELCGGVQIHVTDRASFRPFLAGLAVLREVLRLYPERFAWRKPPYEYEYEKMPIDILLGTDSLRRSLEAGEELRAMEESWQADLGRFLEKRRRYLLY